MSIKERQLGLEDVSTEYQAFLDKFKAKLITDDCYTPENIYEVEIGKKSMKENCQSRQKYRKQRRVIYISWGDIG